MLSEAKDRIICAALVPLAASGAMAFESIVGTPIAEAGGFSYGKVITSPQTPEDQLRASEEFCKKSQSIMRQRPPEYSEYVGPSFIVIISISAGVAAALYYLGRKK